MSLRKLNLTDGVEWEDSNRTIKLESIHLSNVNRNPNDKELLHQKFVEQLGRELPIRLSRHVGYDDVVYVSAVSPGSPVFDWEAHDTIERRDRDG